VPLYPREFWIDFDEDVDAIKQKNSKRVVCEICYNKIRKLKRESTMITVVRYYNIFLLMIQIRYRAKGGF